MEKIETLPLVSAIVPCYNVENKILNLLDSFEHQTYRNFEVYFINDGSTDNTERVILGFINKQIDKHKYNYIKKKNEGVSSAINEGLKHIKGEYLIWPDADDWLTYDSIEKKVNFLINHPEYASITSNAYIVDENRITKFVEDVNEIVTDENQFEHLLSFESQFAPCLHMIRFSFFEKISKREIYDSRGGQNFQMLLPIYYNNKRHFIDEPLCYYSVYNDSLSHKIKSYNELLNELDEFEEIVINTLKKIKIENELDDILKQFYQAIYSSKLNLAYEYNDRVLFNKMYEIVNKNNWKSTIKYILINIGLNTIFNRIKRI